MADATKDFEELFTIFEKHAVRAVIIGAHAVAFHAKPRYTKDLDVLLDSSADNARRAVAALEEFGFGGIGITGEDLTGTGKIIQLGVAPNRIDLVTSVDGVAFD